MIGAGVSGLTAAYVLRRTHKVTIFEAEKRLGGHAQTHGVKTGDGSNVSIDSGFVIYNKRNYPHLARLFRELGIETQKAEMSMSVTCDGCGLSFSGAHGLGGLFTQPTRTLDLRYLKILTEVPRFHRQARAVLSGDAPADLTWGEFLEKGEFSPHFVQHFAMPFVAGVWSAGDADVRGYPARHLFQFLDHHRMLSVSGSARWRTVTGGSTTYVEALAGNLEDVRRGIAVVEVTRRADGVEVRTGAGTTRRFDQVVIATHADDALKLLTDATPQEAADLATIGYSTMRAWLHRDGTVLPEGLRTRASWNYRLSACAVESPALVSYWMNRLQRVKADEDLVVTLNPEGRVDPATVIARMTYRHPVITPATVEAADRLRLAGGPRLAFAGAYLGWGFHEDGCRSGVEAARRLGGDW